MTRKLKVRGLNLGTATDQISAKTFLAGFVPANFTAEQISTEGTDKISAFLKGIDNKLAIITAGIISFTDQYFTGNGSASRVALSTNIAPGTVLDVSVNGILQQETVDYNRDATTDEIIWLNDSVIETAFPNACRILVRIYSSTAGFIDQTFSGGSTPLSLSTLITSPSRIDVYFSGVLKEETADWTRNVPSNQINLVTNETTSLTSIRVRVWS